MENSKDVYKRQALLSGGVASRCFILGGGSNLVLTGDFDGLVLHMAIGGRELVAEDDDAWYVRDGAGENWSDFAGWTLDHGRPGLETLSLNSVPVGAATITDVVASRL